jgi:cytochrome c556
MNKSYTQLVAFVLDSTTDVDFDKIEKESTELASAVKAVRSLPLPSMAQSEEARSVYTTYNDVLQRDTDKFVDAVTAKDRPQMEALLAKVGKTCTSCHKFFRVEVKDAPR